MKTNKDLVIELHGIKYEIPKGTEVDKDYFVSDLSKVTSGELSCKKSEYLRHDPTYYGLRVKKEDVFFTRKDYMCSIISHRDYYSQFVTKSVIGLVARRIGAKRIKKSKDAHLNDIPLCEWDKLAPLIRHISGRMLAEANGNGGVSLSDCVCVAKAAARLIQEKKYE